MKKFLSFLIVVLLLSLALASVQAAKPPLPPIPNDTVLNSVISQTSGIPFDPVGVPTVVMQQLNAFGAPFTNIGSALDVNQAVQYFALDGDLLEIVIPLVGNSMASLVPDMTSPGDNPRPAKVIGALFQPSRGVMVIVAVFPEKDFGCTPPSCHKPEKLRFYFDATNYEESKLDWAKFKDKDHDNLVTAIDEGSLIAHKYSCVTIGLEQVCWKPYDDDVVRQKQVLEDMAKASFENFNDLYEFKSDFFLNDAVPDLLGHALRGNCRTVLANAVTFDNLTACQPNMVFTAAKKQQRFQPVGIFVVQQAADIATYSPVDGSYIGGLPAGEYLVINATPDVRMPGQIGVLMLVNADMQNHYLIPTMVMEGVGRNPAVDKPRAAIKDGYVWGRGFGY